MINVAVVGCGYWGPNVIRSFSQLENAELHTVCDIDKSKLAHIKNMYPKVNITTDYNDILNNPEIDAVVIATPPPTHYALAKDALLKDKHVLLEKPMTKTLSEAQELVNLANKKSRVFMIDHTFEYHPAIRKIKQIIESGEIGDIYYVNAHWFALGLLQPEANVVFDLATHVFSIINYIIGENPLSVIASGQGYIRPEIEEMANIVVKYPKNIIANIQVSWLEPHKTRTLTIIGSKKMVIFDLLNNEEQVKIYDQGISVDIDDGKPEYRLGDTYAPNISKKEPLRIEAEHFIDCIINNKEPMSSGKSGIIVLKQLLAVNESLKNKGVEVLLSQKM